MPNYRTHPNLRFTVPAIVLLRVANWALEGVSPQSRNTRSLVTIRIRVVGRQPYANDRERQEPTLCRHSLAGARPARRLRRARHVPALLPRRMRQTRRSCKCGRIRRRSTPVRLGEGFGGDDDCLEIFGQSLVAVNPAKRCSTAFRPRRDDEADPDREFLSVLGAAGEGDLDERGGSSRSLEPRNGAKYCQRRILIFRSIGSGPFTR